jgi:hypothetical protein
MNTITEARETLAVKAVLKIDRDSLERYFYYDDKFKECCDEYIIEKYEATFKDLETNSITIKSMKIDGVWIEYMNEYFYEFMHMYDEEIYRSNMDFDGMNEYEKRYFIDRERESNYDTDFQYGWSKNDF